MARHLLTDRQVQNAKPKAKPYRLADGDGLYLYVPLSGVSSWQFRYRLGDKPQTATFGRLDRITLGQAIESVSGASGTDRSSCCVAATREDSVATSKVRNSTGRITPSRPARSRTHADFLLEHLADDANVAALLDEALAGGDEGDIMYALRAIAEARGGIASVATATGLSRETLYRTLSKSGNPRLSTLLALVRAAGVRLRVERVG